MRVLGLLPDSSYNTVHEKGSGSMVAWQSVAHICLCKIIPRQQGEKFHIGKYTFAPNMSPALLQNTVTATDDVAVVGNGKMKPSSSPVPDLWITGIGSQYPPYLHPPENFTNFAAKFHDIERPV